MADGLWSVRSSELQALPLEVATRYLIRELQRLDAAPAHLAADQPDGSCILRLELPFAAQGPQVKLLLDWLAAQHGMLPRAMFATRDGSAIIAGAGAAHVHSPSSSERGLLPQLGSATHPKICYIGGARFDSSDPEAGAPSEEWESFGQGYWVLPRVELSYSSQSGATGTNSNGSEASSCPSTPLDAPLQSGGLGQLVQGTVLAVQLRWRQSGERPHSWAEEKSRALQALHRLQPCASVPSRMGVSSRRRDTVSREDFEARVKDALAAFAEGSLTKVVLARRILLELAWPMDAVDILRQVVGSVHKRHYLFLLEPVQGTAFLSLTPERLCKVQGRDVWTEAVAGTWPIAEFEKIGEAALLASSAKHSSEHQLVVDYICRLLDDVSSFVKVCDTHILKLKHLVHIKQSYHAIAEEGQGFSPFDLSTFFCKRMSPTPAVCGLPLNASRRFIRSAEPWDRGFYAAPCGVISARSSELTVALRSALVREGKLLHVFAGAGIVPGSDPAEEFAEISLKMRQFTDTFTDVPEGFASGTMDSLTSLPNLNTLWACLIVEELVRLGVSKFVVCPGSRSTPLVVAVARHPCTKYVVNHDERAGGFYALGWAKAVGSAVAVIVTSGTAVANLLPAAVEAAQSQVPVLLLTADRPAELRDTGANQTIHQPGIFGVYARWSKDFPCPSTEYPPAAILGDMDLAVAHASGHLGRPGPVHLNFCFRENLAPDGGAVRGAPGRTADWDNAYVETPDMHHWLKTASPRSTYLTTTQSLTHFPVLEELLGMAQKGRIVILVGTLRTADEVLLVEDMSLRLGAAVFADITSGLRQRPNVINFSDQLLNSPLLAPELLQIDAVLHLGGAMCSARHNAFSKAAGGARLHIRVAPAPIRMDQDHVATHHLPCSLSALSAAIIEAGLEPSSEPPQFWKRLSNAAGRVIERKLMASEEALDVRLTEPFIAQTVSRLIAPHSWLQISSSMPIRDLDFFSRPSQEASLQPPAANRGASGIDGVISTAAGFCRGANAPSTLIIGDVASLQDLNALQQLTGPDAPPLTIVLVNNGGGGIFSFLPIAQHKDVMSPFFNEPHTTDFTSVCAAFGVPHILCRTPEEFEAAYLLRQSRGSTPGACVIEAQPSLSFEENVAFHKEIGQAVAQCARQELLSQVKLSWIHTVGSSLRSSTEAASEPVLVLLHGWLGEKADWNEVSRRLVEEHGRSVLSVDLPGHGASQVSADACWEQSGLFSLPITVEALADLLEKLHIPKAIFVGYSLGGRVAMAFADRFPDRCLGMIALSANPGLQRAGERHERWQQDSQLAAKLQAIADTTAIGGFEAFLEKWYSVPLWSGLKERRPDVYENMLRKRRRASPQLASRALTGMSLALQPDLWPRTASSSSSKPRCPFWYAYGELDSKFSKIGAELSALSGQEIHVSSIPLVAHALVEESPSQVADLCAKVAQQLLGETPQLPKVPISSELQISAVWSEPIKLMLKAPLLLSRGAPMPERCGLLVILQVRQDGHVFSGLGEVNPLPLFHKETLAEAEEQLHAVLSSWTASTPKVPAAVARLDGSMSSWLNQNCSGQRLLPSVRAGLEMALLHAIGRASGSGHLGVAAAAARSFSSYGTLGLNSLVAREEDLGCDGATVVKLKVGKDPLQDAERSNYLAEVLKSRAGPHARLRFDANQAWTLDEAAVFISNLSDAATAMTDYLEEPVRWHPEEGAEQFMADWQVLSERTQRKIAFAADESLTEGAVKCAHLAECKAPIAALVLKPSLQGIEQTAEFAAWASQHGARPVLSSAFESGVALCHFAILAASTAPTPWLSESSVSDCHGLGTFTRLAEDVLQPPFADLVSTGQIGRGWQVNVLKCQEALDKTLGALLSSRGSADGEPAKANGWF